MPNTLKTNPLGFAYNSIKNLSAYAKPTGMVVAGRSNRNDPAFQIVRAGGGEVLAYFGAIERPNTRVSTLDEEFYMGDSSKVPLWSPAGLSNWSGTKMIDIRAGSTWSNHAVSYIENIMRSGKFDGVFLDVVGARLWSEPWTIMNQSEKDAWTKGNVDLVRRLHNSKMKINPNFIIVNNNVWDRGGGDTLGKEGEQYVNGVCLEGHLSTSAYHKAYAARTFGSSPRRVLIISQDATKWALDIQGVTHVCDQKSYGEVRPPIVPFNRLTDRGDSATPTTPPPAAENPGELDKLRTEVQALRQENEKIRGEYGLLVAEARKSQEALSAIRNMANESLKE